MNAVRATVKWSTIIIGIGLLFALTFHVGYDILPNYTG